MNETISYLIPFTFYLFKYFLLAGIPFLIFYVFYPNVFKNNKIQARLSKRKDFIREFLYSFQTLFILAGIGLLVTQTPLKKYTLFYENISDYPLWWIPLSVLIGLVIHDTYFYWLHRTIHHRKIYKLAHLVHHKSTNPSPWASYSFHFLESILEGMIVPILLILLPMHPVALLAFSLSSFAINVYGHLGYEIFPKRFRHSVFFEILNTSIHHNMHHSKFNYNYGLYLRVWDRLMKTEHPDYVKEYDKIQEKRFGTK